MSLFQTWYNPICQWVTSIAASSAAFQVFSTKKDTFKRCFCSFSINIKVSVHRISHNIFFPLPWDWLPIHSIHLLLLQLLLSTLTDYEENEGVTHNDHLFGHHGCSRRVVLTSSSSSSLSRSHFLLWSPSCRCTRGTADLWTHVNQHISDWLAVINSRFFLQTPLHRCCLAPALIISSSAINPRR